MMKKINPMLIKPMKETLSSIYWTKKDLRAFLYSCFRPETIAILETLDYSDYKYNICENLIDQMIKREDIYQKDLVSMIKALLSFNEFSHFRNVDDSVKLIKNAKDNLTHFKIIAKPLVDNIDTEKMRLFLH